MIRRAGRGVSRSMRVTKASFERSVCSGSRTNPRGFERAEGEMTEDSVVEDLRSSAELGEEEGKVLVRERV